MTNLSNDEPRCAGIRCPSMMNCRRHTERATGGEYAALYARRDVGSSACDMYMPIVPAGIFEASERHALNDRAKCLLSERQYNIVCEKGVEA